MTMTPEQLREVGKFARTGVDIVGDDDCLDTTPHTSDHPINDDTAYLEQQAKLEEKK